MRPIFEPGDALLFDDLSCTRRARTLRCRTRASRSRAGSSDRRLSPRTTCPWPPSDPPPDFSTSQPPKRRRRRRWRWRKNQPNSGATAGPDGPRRGSQRDPVGDQAAPWRGSRVRSCSQTRWLSIRERSRKPRPGRGGPGRSRRSRRAGRRTAGSSCGRSAAQLDRLGVERSNAAGNRHPHERAHLVVDPLRRDHPVPDRRPAARRAARPVWSSDPRRFCADSIP